MPGDGGRFDEYEIGKKPRREINSAGTRGDTDMGRRYVVAPPGSGLNTVTPCAACKLLRRRCAEDCPFSPYFSPHEPLKFAAVHKVFGASNVSKMLLEVAESLRADAANSMVYEANLRLRDPINGCMGAISALQQRIQSLQSELNAVRAEILRYKFREATTAAAAANSPNNIAVAADLIPSAISAVSVASAPPFQPLNPSPPPPQPPPTPPPLPPPSVVVSSSSSSSSAKNDEYKNYSVPYFY